jgi:hypothetical protein
MIKKRLEIIILHSEISAEDQMKAFEFVAGGKRKVIISTSIAESSITVIQILSNDYFANKCVIFLLNKGARHKVCD